ncbi:L-lysine exporter family protein LysE/ArgO [Kytococcus aerolatus]|uniref:L-lysine exporter family protein LysE/ArgO n=1 Tax=Kytococcus aerolatus TaxID=592308 RepID=A0A212U2F8_9MICO|nr:LysE/ArgO family amino acid transporter [Kytococcus aerolatus]SNC72432.1 L-lysine exporter family protein LysE/ArgO [Kytococcus aerolatus]
MVLPIVLAGWLTGIGLIAAVGAQNAYLLRRGLRREHVLPLVLLCSLSDILLIGAGVLGVGAVLHRWPPLLDLVRWGGALFLVGYGASCLWRSARSSQSLTAGQGEKPVSLRRALLTMAGFTWLNPHLYLDITILGGLANAHGPTDRWWYYAGLLAASVTWFSALGFGSARLAPLFARPRAWQVFDLLIGLVMIALGVALVA